MPIRPLLIMLLASASLAAEVRSGFFTTSDGVRLHYLEAGRGPSLVFEPGWTMPADIWQPQIDYFSRNFRVVALDPRSQGESQKVADGHSIERRAQDIKELIDHLKLAPAALAGWSLGVTEVLNYVDQFGTETLSAIILVDGTVGGDIDPAAVVQSWARMEQMQRDRRAYAEHFVRGMYRRPQTEEYLRKVTEASLKTPTNTAVTLFGNLRMKSDNRLVLSRINRPILYAGAAGNKLQGEVLRRGVPWARVAVFEDAGHALFVDDAERFNQVVEEFLRAGFK